MPARAQILPGTLDLLILKAVSPDCCVRSKAAATLNAIELSYRLA